MLYEVITRVLVTLTMPQRHSIPVGVLQVFGHIHFAFFFNLLKGFEIRPGAVRFRCGRQVKRRFNDRSYNFV